MSHHEPAHDDAGHDADDHAHDAHYAHDAEPNGARATSAGVVPVLDPRPERRLLRAGGSSSYLDLVVRLTDAPRGPNRSRPDRPPVHVALVIDRSGSMKGEKIHTAKRAALAVLDGLDERDTAAVVVFDDRIDIVQTEAAVTPLLRAHVTAELGRKYARGYTALYEGWLEGCRAIAADAAEVSTASDATESSAASAGSAGSTGEACSGGAAGMHSGVRRCFLLTDGRANVGLTDPEALAQAAGQVREMAHVSTSTFGIGYSYDEELLGPMAEASGGQFHHLRMPQEIAATFLGELGQLLGTLARDARLVIETAPGMAAEVVSAYPWRAGAPHTAGGGRWEVTVGDLVGGEERHVVVRLDFPSAADAAAAAMAASAAGEDAHGEHGELGEHSGHHEQTVQVRLTWQDDAGSHASAWQGCSFRYAASEAEYEAEPRDETVLHYAAQHLSDRAQRDAISAWKRGDVKRARSTTQAALSALARLALQKDDTVLATELRSLLATENELEAPALDPLVLKERYYRSQTRASGKTDLRESKSSMQSGRQWGRQDNMSQPLSTEDGGPAPDDPTDPMSGPTPPVEG